MRNIEKHISIVAWLQIALNIISIGFAVFFGMYFATTFLPVAIILFSIPGLVAGFGLLKRKSWSRVLGIVMSILNLLTVPHGTVIGVYSMGVLLDSKAIQLFRNGNEPAE